MDASEKELPRVMPDVDELSLYGVSVMAVVTSWLAHYSSPLTHTSALVFGIVAYRSRLACPFIFSGFLHCVSHRLYAASIPCSSITRHPLQGYGLGIPMRSRFVSGSWGSISNPHGFFHLYAKFFRDRMNIGDLEVDERVRPGVTLVFGEEQFHRAAFDGYKGRESGLESMHGRFTESKSLMPGRGSRRILNAAVLGLLSLPSRQCGDRYALFLYPVSMDFVQGVLKTRNDANYWAVPKHKGRSILPMRACRKQNRIVPVEPFLNTAIRFRTLGAAPPIRTALIPD